MATKNDSDGEREFDEMFEQMGQGMDMDFLNEQTKEMERQLRQMKREYDAGWRDQRIQKVPEEQVILPGSHLRIWGAYVFYYNKYGHNDYKNGIFMISTKLKVVNRAAKKELRRRHRDDHFDDDCFSFRPHGALTAFDLYPDGGGCVLNMEGT